MLSTGKITLATKTLDCVSGTHPVCTIDENSMTVQTGHGSTYRIDLDANTRMYSLFVIMKERILPTLGWTEREVLLATRRSFRRICIEMAKWELYRAIKGNFKV